jgi:hypothetical protein
MTTSTFWADRALQHTRHLAERIGPRGAATPEEKRAADYALHQLQKIGAQDVRLESFRAPRSGWLPIAIVFSIAVWSSFLCWGSFYLTQGKAIGGLIGAVLCALGVWIVYRHITFKDHPLRRLTGQLPSVNVIGRIAAADQARQRVVLVANLDTSPAAWIFQGPRRAKFLRFMLTASFVSLIVGAIMFVLGAFDLWDWGFVFAGMCGVLQSVGILMAIQADQGDFGPGANDNGSGVGTVLALAERLQPNPLPHTEVWIVLTGSHTINGHGLCAFLDQHDAQIGEAWFIGFEGVGIGARLIAAEREGPLRRSIRSEVRELLERANRARADRAAQPRSATDRSSIVAPAIWRGLKGVCLSVYATRNAIPNRRSRNDTASAIESSALELAHDFGWELLQMIEER